MLKNLLDYIVKVIVKNKDNVEIAIEEREGKQAVTIYVSKEDLGKVIGKGGKTIKSVRALVATLFVDPIRIEVISREA